MTIDEMQPGDLIVFNASSDEFVIFIRRDPKKETRFSGYRVGAPTKAWDGFSDRFVCDGVNGKNWRKLS